MKQLGRRAILRNAALASVSATAAASLRCGPADKAAPTHATYDTSPPVACETPIDASSVDAQFGCVVDAGGVNDLPPGKKVHFVAPKLWLVRFDAAQASHVGAQSGSFLALFHRCNHLGCTVPWRPDFTRDDPRDGKSYAGWFLCPCHNATHDDAGVRVFGPSPRPLDTCALRIENGRIIVDTGVRTTGAADNPLRAIAP